MNTLKIQWIIISLLIIATGTLYYNFFSLKTEMAALTEKVKTAHPDPKEKHLGDYREKAVAKSLKKKNSEIQKCYNNFLKTNPKKTDGSVDLDWQIDKDGKVLVPEIVGSDLANTGLNDCIRSVIASIKFPPPPSGNITYIDYKYHFKKPE